MADKTYASFQAIIMAKLAALQDGNSVDIFAGVFASNVTDPDGYPIAYVVEKKGSSAITDTHRNSRTWEFAVVIHYAIGDEKEEDANSKLLATVDQVITMFDQDPMLVDEHGIEQCKRVTAVPVEFERARQDVAIIRALLNVQVMDLVPRYAA